MTLLRHLALRTRDVQASRRFYEQGLGLRFVDFRPGGSGAMDLSDGTVNLTLIPYEGPPRTPLEEGFEFIHLGFLVEDLGAVYRRLMDLGAPVVREDVKVRRALAEGEVPTGSMKALDPDGNVLDITERHDEWRA